MDMRYSGIGGNFNTVTYPTPQTPADNGEVKRIQKEDKIPGEYDNENDIIKVDKQLTMHFLQKTIDRVNEKLFGSNREVSYGVHEKTGQFMFKIVDTETKEIIREVPPEKMLDTVAKMWELAGILFDVKNIE